MKKIILIFTFLVAFISCAFTQVIDLSPEAARYDLKVLNTNITSEAYCSEYQAVYDAYTTKPDAATADIWNTFVETVVASGEWVILDVFYVYAAHTNGAGEALINWFNPGTFNATAFNAPTFTINEGFTGDGLITYINHNWNLFANGINYAQNSACMGCYIRTNTNGDYDVGCGDGASYAVISARHVNLYRLLFNDAIENTAASADARGMLIASRTGANIEKLYRNKVSIINSADASIGVPNANFYSLCWNSSGVAQNFMDRQLSMVFAGGRFTQTNVDNFTDAFEVAMDALGKGVIP